MAFCTEERGEGEGVGRSSGFEHSRRGGVQWLVGPSRVRRIEQWQFERVIVLEWARGEKLVQEVTQFIVRDWLRMGL